MVVASKGVHKAISRWCWGILLASLSQVFCLTWAQAETRVFAEVDKVRGTTDDHFVLQVQVEGGKAERSPEPPQIEGMDIQSAGSSSNISMINGSITRSHGYRFVLRPLRTGSFRIDPIEVKVGGKAFKTEPIQIQVEQGQVIDRDEAFVERTIEAEKIFVGQSLPTITRIYSQPRLQQGRLVADLEPHIERRTIEGEQSYERVINGQRYRVIEVVDVLIGRQAGKVNVGSYRFDGEFRIPNRRSRSGPRSLFDDFDFPGFGGQGNLISRSILGEEKWIEVVPLPEDGKPDGFSGLVGSFELKAEISHDRAEVGETVTVEIQLQGVGSLEDFKGIDWPQQADFKVYPDKPELREIKDSQLGMRSQASYRFALVPLRPGANVVIPALKIWIFDTSSEKYRQISTAAFEIEVYGEASTNDLEAAAGRQRGIKNWELNDDFIGPNKGTGAWGQRSLDLDTLRGTAVAQVSSLFLLAALLVYQRRRGSLSLQHAKDLKQKSNALQVALDKHANQALDEKSAAELLPRLQDWYAAADGEGRVALAKKEQLKELCDRLQISNGSQELMAFYQSLQGICYGGQDSDSVANVAVLKTVIKEVDARCFKA